MVFIGDLVVVSRVFSGGCSGPSAVKLASDWAG